MKKGALLLLMTAALWSLGGLWVKFIDWNPVAIAGARSLIAFVVIATVMPRALSQLTWDAVPGAIAYAAVMFLFVLATKLTTAANAVFLHCTAPIHIALIAPWLLGERTHWRDWILIVMALGGVALFFCDELDLKSRWGLLAGLGSGFCSAWLIMLLGLMFNAQMETSLAVAELLTKGRVFRVDETVPDGWFSLDAIEQIGNMVALARGLAVKREILSTVEQRFLNGVHAESFT